MQEHNYMPNKRKYSNTNQVSSALLICTCRKEYQ